MWFVNSFYSISDDILKDEFAKEIFIKSTPSKEFSLRIKEEKIEDKAMLNCYGLYELTFEQGKIYTK